METAISKNNKAKSLFDKAAAAVKSVPTPVYQVGGLITLYWWGIRPIFKDLNPDKGNDAFRDEVDKLNTKTNDGSTRPTINKASAKSIAGVQFAAMKNPGTKVNMMLNSLQNLTGKDLQEVYKAFGRKWYDPILGAEGGKAFEWAGNREIDLFNWYVEELGGSDLQQMQDIWWKSGLPFGQKAGVNGLQNKLNNIQI